MFKERSTTQELEVKVDILNVSLILHILFIATYIFNCVGIGIPLLRQAVGLFYSLFVPGLLLMLTLKIKEGDCVDFLLYCIGLSLSSLMLLGLVLNFAGPLIGIARPLSMHSTGISVIAMSTALWVSCKIYRRESAVVTFQLNKKLAPWAIAFLSPIFMSVFGAYLVYYEDNNLLLMALLLIVALMAFSPLSKRLRPLYPLIIFAASISLIYHIVLSSYSFGGDNHVEYGFSELMLEKGIWNPSIMANSNNAVISINILVPIFCHLCGVNVLQIFKVIYPIILSLVPVSLYSILKNQIEPDFSFFSAYFYISVRYFYTNLSEFTKQGFSIFFLILVILILTSRIKRDVVREFMLTLFSFALITSHYGVSYLFLIFILIAYVFRSFSERHARFDRGFGSFIFFYMVLTVSWYIYTSSGSAFESVVRLGSVVISNIQELFNPRTSDTLVILLRESPYLSKIVLKWLYMISNAFIALGFLMFIYDRLNRVKRQAWNLSVEYGSFVVPSLGFLIASLFPYVTSGMDIFRSYCIILLFLAPFHIIGFTGILNYVRKVSRRNVNVLKVLAFFFAVFLLFNSGWVTEIVGEKELGSVAISQARVKSSGTPFEKASLYIDYFAEEDIFSGKWLSEHRATSLVSSDFDAVKVLSSYGMLVGKSMLFGKEQLSPNSIKDLDSGTYVYLRKLNWIDGIMTYGVYTEYTWKIWNTSDVMMYLNDMELIYSNGGSVIFFKE